LLRRQAGYYLNVGASDLIVEGKIKLKAEVGIELLTADKVIFSDGGAMAADLVVLATGYQPIQETVRRLFGDEVADCVGPVWGIGDDGELRNMYAPTAQQGLYFVGGGFPAARTHSPYTAMFIKASMQGLISSQTQGRNGAGPRKAKREWTETTWRQHRVVDACAVSLRFAAAPLSRDTLRSGPFTVGRAVATEIATRTSTVPVQVATPPTKQARTNHEQRHFLARRLRPRRPPSQKPLARPLALCTTGIGTSVFRWRQHRVVDACAVSLRFAAAPALARHAPLRTGHRREGGPERTDHQRRFAYSIHPIRSMP
jgi:hypothetical protein